MWIDYGAHRNVLVALKGHPYDQPALARALGALAAERGDLTWTGVDQPAVNAFLTPETAAPYAALLFYDLPGIDLRAAGGPTLHRPSAEWQRQFEALLAVGKPMVFLHHAICGWPAYPRYAEVIGGRYLYLPQQIDGRLHPDSGYLHDRRHHIAPLAAHPVTRGLEAGFDLVGELYLYEVFEHDVLPLMRCTDVEFTRAHFYSSAAAIAGRRNDRDGWQPGRGSDLVVWARRDGRSPIVYIQCGHDAAAFDDANFRRLLGNAIDWVTSADARVWASAPRR